MKSSRKRQTCWDRDETREIDREISLSVNTSCSLQVDYGLQWHISFHFMLSLHVCRTAVEPCNMDYTDISIAHIHTTLAPKTTWIWTRNQFYCSLLLPSLFLKGIAHPNLNSVIYSLHVISNFHAAILLEKHKSRIYLRIITQPLP